MLRQVIPTPLVWEEPTSQLIRTPVVSKRPSGQVIHTILLIVRTPGVLVEGTAPSFLAQIGNRAPPVSRTNIRMANAKSQISLQSLQTWPAFSKVNGALVLAPALLRQSLPAAML